MTLRIGSEVADAQAEGRAVVALESTIFSTLGLPAPRNEEALRRVDAAVRASGAVPALTAVLDAQAVIGCSPSEAERVLSATTKLAARDLAPALGAGTDGVTTVSATLTLAAATGIDVFSTGGIGGVHRDVAASSDVSADLDELACRSVVTICAGAKAFLDLERTLEVLESLGVLVLGWRTDEFPAFWSRSSGIPLAHRADSADAVAEALGIQRSLGRAQGIVLAVPVPSADEIDRATVDAAITEGLQRATASGAQGPTITPVVLETIAEATDGASVDANLALAEHNAEIAGDVATRLAGTSGSR